MSALTEIEKLALHTAKEAQKDATDLTQKVDALKALTPYYTLLKKAKLQESYDDAGSLADLASQIHEADDGPSNGLLNRGSGRA